MHKKRKTKKISAVFLLLSSAAWLFAQEYKVAEPADFEGAFDADTFFVYGSHSYGILNLPATPNAIPYIINERIEYENERIVLPMGRHRIFWDGGIGYVPIDTFADVRAGEIVNLNFNFTERRGTLFIETEPDEARIFLNSELAGVGVLFRDLQAGNHLLSVSAQGHHSIEQTVSVSPGRVSRYNIRLPSTYDRDGDGFPDSVDLCPDVFGIYHGCPRPQLGHELRNLRDFWRGYLDEQPFTIEILAFGFQYRIASEPLFRELISLFNDGPAVGTNHRGFSAFNKIWIANARWIASLEYGQGFLGSRYRKSFDINVDNDFHLIYDKHWDLEPTIKMRSFSGQFGFRAGNEILSLAILTGYQAERITLTNISEFGDDRRRRTSSRTSRNNVWITSVRAVLSPSGENFNPAFFIEMSVTPIVGEPRGKIGQAIRPEETGWIGFRSGVILPWRLIGGN